MTAKTAFVLNMVLSPITRELTGLEKEQRATIASNLHSSPTTELLQTYLEKLKTGLSCSNWNVDTFSEGARVIAKICGADKAKYYDKSLEGLHYPTTFIELWNEANPKYPVTVWDQDFRRQCPAGWEHRQEGACWVVRYLGAKPLSQGLNDFLRGPTTIDCGMFCQFILWMAIRYLVGDDLFDASFKFEAGDFVLTQSWIESPDSKDLTGNPLYWFYDAPHPRDTLQGVTTHQRIGTRTFFNHPAYLVKHLGGMDLLHNVTQIDGYNHIFHPASKNVLSDAELDQMLLEAYNEPQDLADLEKIYTYEKILDGYAHPDFHGVTCSELARHARASVQQQISQGEWSNGQSERQARATGMHLIFNFERLNRCLHTALSRHELRLDTGDLLLLAKMDSLKWKNRESA